VRDQVPSDAPPFAAPIALSVGERRVDAQRRHRVAIRDALDDGVTRRVEVVVCRRT
jgi:hypothetical protein